MNRNAGVSNKDYEERMRILQRRLGTPETGYYTNADHDRLRILPRLNRDIIRRHYGVYAEPTSQRKLAEELGVKPSTVTQTISECFALLQRVRELEAEDLREELRKERAELEKRVPTNLNADARRGIRRAIYRLEDILKNDGVASDNNQKGE